MNGKRARALRQMARDEMARDPGVVDRELVITRRRGANDRKTHDLVVNHPTSVRAMHIKLKDAYKNLQRNPSPTGQKESA